MIDAKNSSLLKGKENMRMKTALIIAAAAFVSLTACDRRPDIDSFDHPVFGPDNIRGAAIRLQPCIENAKRRGDDPEQVCEADPRVWDRVALLYAEGHALAAKAREQIDEMRAEMTPEQRMQFDMREATAKALHPLIEPTKRLERALQRYEQIR